jgi:molybdopterin synthase sulfur carrier subunit
MIMDTDKSKINLLAFGQLTDITGQNTWQMDDITDTDQLQKILVENYPALANSKYLVAVNMEVIRGNVTLNPGDVVALLPPFSGG